jgi:pyruvate dehydrogenase E2 component (dihydrolipoamide acetyltransferase)
MPLPFIMPKFDMDQEHATISSWLKGEGDLIKANETVLVVETEKVAIDVPAPASGKLVALRYKPGDVVPVTTVIAFILKEGETVADLPEEPTAAAPPIPPQTSQIQATSAESPKQTPQVMVTPVAARLAKEKGVDLAAVTATNGRVSREDVERFIAADGADERFSPVPGRAGVPATPAARRLARESGLELASVVGTGPNQRVQSADIIRSMQQKNDFAGSSLNDRKADVTALVGMRQKIAERMTASFHEMPHISLTVEADVSNLEAVHTRLSGLAKQEGIGTVSLTALLVKATAWALMRNPSLNASLVNGQIYKWQDVNIGVATAVPDGLIVPVIHQADLQSVRQIAIGLQDLTSRAKQNRLNLEDVQHGTFTISNLGMYGIRQFRAIINPPECAILAVGAVVRKPVVLDDSDTVVVRPIITMTLSADHRLIDGIIAARFLADLVMGVEKPESLLY